MVIVGGGFGGLLAALQGQVHALMAAEPCSQRYEAQSSLRSSGAENDWQAPGLYALVSAANAGAFRIPLAEIAAKTTDRRERMA